MDKPEVKLEQWSVSSLWPAWVAPNGSLPDCSQIRLSGAVYGYDRFDDGERVSSSVILNVQGRRIETMNTIYMLGDIDPKYYEWCVEQGCHIPTDEEPILTERL